MMISYLSCLVWMLGLVVHGQVTETNINTCTYSFVVPQTDIVSTCKAYSNQQVEILQRKITDLQNRVDLMQMSHKMTNVSAMNPTFSCSCDNTTTFAFAFRDCQDVKNLAAGPSGVYEIEPVKSTGHLISVLSSPESTVNQKYWATTTWGSIRAFCDLEAEDVGWTVIMRRQYMNVSFDRTWDEYKSGFGDVNNGDFWMGLENMYRISSQTFVAYNLWIIVHDLKGIPHVIPYGRFKVSSEEENYRLTVSDYHGQVGNDLYSSVFVTKDHESQEANTKDVDDYDYSPYMPSGPTSNCAKTGGILAGGGWWFSERGTKYTYYGSYRDKYMCGTSNLNAKTPQWEGIRNITSVIMKIRPSE